MTVTAMPPPTSDAPAAAGAPAAKGGGVKKIAIILVAVLALGGGGYWFFLRPTPPAPPTPGEVVKLDPIQVNLAAAHYLRLGLALQLTTKAHEADGSKALDAAIEIFSGQPMADVNDPAKRQHYKESLEKKLEHLYHGDVMGVYFTEFVTQ